jgi:hypothetical protein
MAASSKIALAADNPLPPLRCEPFPNLGHILQLFFVSRVFRFSRDLTALSGVLFVFQDFLHGGSPVRIRISRRRIAANVAGLPELLGKSVLPQ